MLKYKITIGVPSFDASKCVLKKDGIVTEIGRRKAKDIVFQSLLDGDTVGLGDPIIVDGMTIQMIVIYDKHEFQRAMESYKAKG